MTFAISVSTVLCVGSSHSRLQLASIVIMESHGLHGDGVEIQHKCCAEYYGWNVEHTFHSAVKPPLR